MVDAKREGRLESLNEGIDKGRNKERIKFARKLLAKNMPIEEMTEYTGFSQEKGLSGKRLKP